MAMTFEQYKELRKKGYSPEQLQGLQRENKPKGFFTKLGESLKSRASNVQRNAESLATGKISRPEYTLRGFGQAAGAIGDVAGAAISGIAKAGFNQLSPGNQSDLKRVGSAIAQSRPGQVALGAAQTGMEAYGGFKERNPRLAENIEAVGNIATAVPVGFGAKVVGKEGVNIAKDAANLSKRVGKSNIDDVIETGISNGIRPTVVGKNNLNQLNQYKSRAKDAVLNIVKNKQNLSYTDEFGEAVTGKLPESLKELTEAVDQTKKRIFSEYSALATKAGGTGVVVDLNKVTGELNKIVNDKVIQTISPETAQYASNLIDRFAKQGNFTPEQAQQAIANLNESLQSFYKNPTYGTYRQAQIDALIANNLRESLDEVITKGTGPGYAELKKAYGALKTIEKDAIKRAVVEGRKNAKGLVDFTDIFSAGDVVMGVASGNPAQVAKGAFQKAVASYIKRLNSPDNAIKKMFNKVEKAVETTDFKPQSMTGMALESMKGKGGLSIQDVSRGKTELLKEAKTKVKTFMSGLKDDKFNEFEAKEYLRKIEKNLNQKLPSSEIKAFMNDAQSKLDEVLKVRGKEFMKSERIKELMQSAAKATDYTSWIKNEGVKASEAMKQLYLDAKQNLRK